MRHALRLTAAAVIVCLAACATASAPSQPATSRTYADRLIGRVANLRSDHAEAAARYFDALQRAPREDRLLNGAVTASLAAGDFSRARQAARLAPRQGAPAYAHMVRAADQLRDARIGAATSELERVEGAAAEQLVARMMLVWSRAAAGQVDSVVSDLAPLASIRPYGSLFTYQQAMALDLAGRNEEALASYAEAAGGAMSLPPAAERHADLLVRMGARDDAVALLSSEQNQTNPALVAALARINANASASTRRLDPARGGAIGLYGLAAIFQQEHDATNALATLTLVLMLDPEQDAARILAAQIQTGLDHHDAARAMLSAVPATSPYAATARIMDAYLLADEGQNDEALALARAAADGGDLRAKRALADMYRNLERYGEAEVIYGELLAVQPDQWRLYFARGAAREQLGRWPEAEADLRRALELSPEQPDVMNYLAYAWVDRGENLQEGLAMLRRAVELRPLSGAIIDSLGWAYFRLGDYAQAVTYLERAVELEPADATLNDHLGDVYWRLGRRIEARFQWRRTLTLEPDNAQAIEAKIENGLPEEPPTRSATR